MTQALLKIEFGTSIDSIKSCFDSACWINGCPIPAVVRLFAYTDHWLVQEYIKENKFTEHGKRIIQSIKK